MSAVRTLPSLSVASWAVVGLVVVLLAAPAAWADPPGVTERVSVGTGGTAGDNDSQLPAISGNGRYVAFVSSASTLVAGDTNGTSDVFVHDRATGVTERVSVDSKGRQSDGEADGVLDVNFGRPAITPDGRYVAFASSATNLVKGDKNNAVDIFLRDRLAGTTERVNTVGRKTVANAESSHPAISPDGRYVAFQSFADNLVPGDTNFTSDVFLRDRQTDTIVRVSLTSTGEQASNFSGSPAISADGRFVAFESSAVLVPGEAEDFANDIYLRDVQAGTTVGIGTSGSESVGHSGAPTITPDGRFVAFHSWDDGLVPGDTNNSYDVFVHDRAVGGPLERVSVSSAGVQGNDWSQAPAISDDGRFVAFQSFADNLIDGDTNFDYDVFIRDRQAATTVRASVRTDGSEGGLSLASFAPSLSADGSVVAFASEADLVAGDSGFPVDVYVHDHP
jgi:Tol biopolymer transport system component